MIIKILWIIALMLLAILSFLGYLQGKNKINIPFLKNIYNKATEKNIPLDVITLGCSILIIVFAIITT